jgi:hypothetical protein
MDSLDRSRASVSAVLVGSHSVTPGLVSQTSLSRYIPQVPCLSGASDLVSDDKRPFVALALPHRLATVAEALLLMLNINLLLLLPN